MTTSHDHLVQSQFGATSADYVTSAVHAAGADLDRIAALAQAARPSHALDLGAGGGHVSYAIAPYAHQITACDLSSEMLTAIAGEAERRGISNIANCAGAAEALPFAADSFDFLACRFSAHHWCDVESGLREARRVLRAGSPAIFVDVVAPHVAAADTHLQAVELLRDPSHVRDYRPMEWMAMLERSGFDVQAVSRARLRMDFSTWTARMRTAQAHSAAIRSLQARAQSDVTQHFAIEADGSFTIDTMFIEAI